MNTLSKYLSGSVSQIADSYEMDGVKRMKTRDDLQTKMERQTVHGLITDCGIL